MFGGGDNFRNLLCGRSAAAPVALPWLERGHCSHFRRGCISLGAYPILEWLSLGANGAAVYAHWRWHLDEVFVKINGEKHYLWRAVDHEGEVLEAFATRTRDKAAALKFLKKMKKRHGKPKVIVTDKLRSYGAAMKEIGNAGVQKTGRWLNNRVENSHQPFRRRERAMLRFRRMYTLQKFSAVHASVHNHFNHERHLVSRNIYKARRSAALVKWQAVMG